MYYLSFPQYDKWNNIPQYVWLGCIGCSWFHCWLFFTSLSISTTQRWDSILVCSSLDIDWFPGKTGSLRRAETDSIFFPFFLSEQHVLQLLVKTARVARSLWRSVQLLQTERKRNHKEQTMWLRRSQQRLQRHERPSDLHVGYVVLSRLPVIGTDWKSDRQTDIPSDTSS